MAATASRCSDCGTGLGELNADRTGDLLCIGCYLKRYPAEVVAEAPAKSNGKPAAVAPKLRVLDVERMLTTEPPPVPWTVEPLLARGCVTMIAGREGTGKSMLALALGAAIGHGASIAGLDCRAGRVLYVDAENGEREAHRRVRGLGVKPGTLVYVEACGFNLAQHITLLEVLVEEHKPDVLILDSLRSLAPGLDENDSKQAEAAVRPVSRLAQTVGIPVELLHHAGKNGHEYRGSTAIGAAVEIGFTLSRHDEDPDVRTRRKLSCWKSRPAPEPDVRWLSLEAAGGRILVGEAEPFKPAQRRERDTYRDTVLAFREQGLSVREIAEKVSISKSSVQRILDDCPSVPDPLGGWDSGTPAESGSTAGNAVSQPVGTAGTDDADAEMERVQAKFPEMFGGVA
ncbi:MAG: AAA family ATPase [Actinomycetota bacterium]|nr:AAA family ATPase [Actinomycetota bacterium]